ncbi:MAG: FKBP-type peptidyl-prolyl cis-trans isomerase [Lacunisphaera sp.]
MKFRNYGPLLICGVFLAFIAWQARTGIFRRAHPGEPANKYMRQVLENPQTSEADAAILLAQFDQAPHEPFRPALHPAPARRRPAALARGAGDCPLRRVPDERHEGRQLARSGHAVSFRIGTGTVIKGWDEAFSTMKKGERRTLLVPWWLAYGETGKGPVPPKAMLRFEVELIDIR